jgi:hypothetical protein
LNIIKIVYRYPFIHNITKQTLFGNKIDKTIDYYMDIPIASVLEEDFIIKYSISGKNYVLHCNSETLYDGYMYIKNFKVNPIPPPRKVLTAYIDNGHVVTDITNHVKELAGPDYNFYSYSKFKISAEHVSDIGTLIIITDDLNIYHFSGIETVDINMESVIKIDRHN